MRTPPGDQSRRSHCARTRNPRRGRRSMAGAPGPRSHAAERPVNSPSCGSVNKRPRVFAEAAAKPSPIPACDRCLPAPSLTLQTDEAPATAACMPSMQRARDGSELRWGEADTPVPAAADFSGNPSIGHGSGLSSAAGSRCHGGVPSERRPGPPGNRAIRAARPRC